LRYVALNPVRARLVARAQNWRWSSVQAHIAGQDDHVVTLAPALDRVGNFANFLSEEFDEALAYAALRKAETLGRPVGAKTWLAEMEARTGLSLQPSKRGPKPKNISGISHLSP
jgi:putative transposase